MVGRCVSVFGWLPLVPHRNNALGLLAEEGKFGRLREWEREFLLRGHLRTLITNLRVTKYNQLVHLP